MKNLECKIEFDFKNIEFIEEISKVFEEIMKDDRISESIRFEYLKKYTDCILNNKQIKEILEKLGN